MASASLGDALSICLTTTISSNITSPLRRVILVVLPGLAIGWLKDTISLHPSWSTLFDSPSIPSNLTYPLLCTSGSTVSGSGAGLEVGSDGAGGGVGEGSGAGSDGAGGGVGEGSGAGSDGTGGGAGEG